MYQLIVFRCLPFRNTRSILQPAAAALNMNIYCQKPRYYSQPQEKSKSSSKSIAQTKESAYVSTDVKPLGEKIKENAKTASYTGIILLGVGVTGIIFYAVCRELFSSNSPNNIYSEALDRVINDYRVQDALGSPIKGFGEETRRRRRTHVAHSLYERNGVDIMRMQFYVQGIRNKATVHLEMTKMSGNFKYRYLFVQLDHYPRTTIILEDNRADDILLTPVKNE